MSSQRYNSESSDASPLGKPLKYEFSGRTAKNRFLKAAMTERVSSWDPKNLQARGVPSKQLINMYKRWGEGEYGQILTGNIMIEYDHLEASGNPIIPREANFTDERFEAFKELATQAKAHGSLIVGQVSHPGRQVEARIQPNPISASDVQLMSEARKGGFAKPRPATQEDINNVIEGFAHAAEYLEKAGYDGIELHGAHGYLLSQFLSPTTNKRTDKYGGTMTNKIRLIIEIAEEVRKRVSSSFIVGIKINSVEFQDKGLQPEEAREVCQELEKARFDYVELSGGTYESLAFAHKRESTRARESFFLEFAEKIVKPLTKTKTYITGGFKTVGAMVKALETVDGVGIGRSAAQEFDLPKKMLNGDITGALKLRIDPDNFAATSPAAGAQMKQVGKDQEPIDLSVQKNVDFFLAEVKKWQKELGEDESLNKYGYPDLPLDPVPYGSRAML